MIRAWQSWWMTLAPPRFWGRVTPAHNATGYVVWWPLVLAVSLAFFGGAVRLGYLYFTGWKGAWTAWSGGPPQGWTLARTMLVESFIAPYYADSRYWRYNSSSEETTAMWAAPAATVCAAVVSGLTLMCLTSSRRICGVRTVHIVRASVYRTAPLVGFMAVLSARRSAEGTWLERLLAGHAGEAALMLTVAVSLLWALWWWRTVVLKGWVMPGSRVAATLIGVVDVLAGVAVFSELSPYSVGRLFY
jgi:hypothetical protein